MTQPQISIRRATVGDAEALSRLSSRVFPLGCPAETPAEDLAAYMAKELTPERFRAYLEDDRVVILVAETPLGLAAYAHLARESSNAQVQSPLQCEVRRFYVDAAYHGRGVADVLMTEALACLADGGEGAVWLSVFSGNERAIAFYKRWGFQIVGTQYFLVGSDNQKDY
ncbi:MAG TPA: GNAT family N-acetyltransferase, partial [Terriglobales bacterium]